MTKALGHYAANILSGSVLLGQIAAGPLSAQTAEKIMRQWDRNGAFRNEVAVVTMTLVNKNGRERVRRFKRLVRSRDDGFRNILIEFLAPTDIAGTKLLTLERPTGSDDQFFYLPALKQVRRMLAGNDRDRFMGSDFTFGDLKTEKFDRYEYRNPGLEQVGERTAYKIVATPRDSRTVRQSGYSKRVFWVDTLTYADLKREYYGKSGQLEKSATFENINPVEGLEEPMHRPRKVVLVDHKRKHTTILETEEIRADKTLDPNMFTRKYLMR